MRTAPIRLRTSAFFAIERSEPTARVIFEGGGSDMNVPDSAPTRPKR